jgi:hypothetical protein
MYASIFEQLEVAVAVSPQAAGQPSAYSFAKPGGRDVVQVPYGPVHATTHKVVDVSRYSWWAAFSPAT